MRKGRPAALSELMGEFLKRPEIQRGLPAGRVLALWPKLVGPELARLTRPEAFRRGVLWVAVKDHVLAHQLGYQKPTILAKYAHALGEGVVNDVRFRAGPVLAETPAHEPAPEPRPRLDAEAEAWLLETIRPLPDALKRPALKAGRTLLARVQGAPRCPVCQGPSEAEGAPCPSCRLRLELPEVRAEARRLAKGAAPRLEGDLAAAARHRALGELAAELERLAARAAARPQATPELLQAALGYLRLALGREPRPEDLAQLPPAIQSLLSSRLGHRS